MRISANTDATTIGISNNIIYTFSIPPRVATSEAVESDSDSEMFFLRIKCIEINYLLKAIFDTTFLSLHGFHKQPIGGILARLSC